MQSYAKNTKDMLHVKRVNSYTISKVLNFKREWAAAKFSVVIT